MLQVMIKVTTNLKDYEESHGKKIIISFVLIDLKKQNKEDIVFEDNEATPQTKAV